MLNDIILFVDLCIKKEQENITAAFGFSSRVIYINCVLVIRHVD